MRWPPVHNQPSEPFWVFAAARADGEHVPFSALIRFNIGERQSALLVSGDSGRF